MKVCCDTEGRELTDERRYAPTSVPLRRKPCSRSPETLFHFTGIPIYDMARNEAWVSVGCDHDTPTFAVASIRHWWQRMGQSAYPDATTLYITADAGGSNGYRLRSWKHELQKLADETRLTIQVSHFPPGTSKWNKVEHRLFCHITANWRGTPLTTYETIVDRIGNTRTEAGLQVQADRCTLPATRSVVTNPGATAPTKMPCGASASASDWLIAFMPALLAP